MSDTFTLIAGQRRAVADLLGTLDDEQWLTPSLCRDWTVREVAAHLAMPFHMSTVTMLWRVLKAKGDFDRVADAYARVAAEQPTAVLVTELRDHAEDRFTPPGAGPEAPLTDLVIHGLDIGVPLGRRVPVPDEAMPVVLAFLLTKMARRSFVPASRLAGLRFEASDVDWSTGEGPTVAGPAQSLALALAGRRPGLDDLHGPGVEELGRRLA